MSDLSKQNPRLHSGSIKRGIINFGGSIFRRRNDQQPTVAGEQAHQVLLAQRLADRTITLKQNDLKALTNETPQFDWAIVNGQITLPATAFEGLLEGRTRIRAQHLKNLVPPPITADVPDAIEYEVSLAVIIDQIQDLLQPAEVAPSFQPQFETPFTAIAKEDSLRFANATDKSHNATATAIEDRDASTYAQGSTPVPGAQSQPLRNPPKLVTEPQPFQNNATAQLQVTKPTPSSDDHFSSEEITDDPLKRSPGSLASASSRQTAFENVHEDASDGLPTDGTFEPGELPRRGVQQLQEIFMVDEPLDGRRIAFLVRQFPGVNGALILLEGGGVLGGQLPHWLNLQAALQAPEALAQFIRFIVGLEAGQSPQSKLVTVTSATTITLVHSGKIALLVSHRSRKLPPGLQQRLTETAEALNLIYGHPSS